jgi:hypothetical protein
VYGRRMQTHIRQFNRKSGESQKGDKEEAREKNCFVDAVYAPVIYCVTFGAM